MNENLEQEIADLEQQLEQKKAQLGQESAEPLEPAQERDLVHEVIGEQIQQVQPSLPPSDDDDQTLAEPEDDEAEPPEVSDSFADQVQTFVNTAFTMSVKDAISAVVKTNNAALIDAFHDALADELYDELVSRKKLDKPA